MDKKIWLQEAEEYLNIIFDGAVESVTMDADFEEYIDVNPNDDLRKDGLHIGQMAITVQLRSGKKFELWASEWGGIKLTQP